MLAEQSSWAATYAATAMSDPAVAPDVGILAAHAYSGAYSAMSLASYGNVTNQHLWQTEVSDFDDTYDGSITSALTYATQIYQWLVGANANAWLYWLVSGEGVYSDNEALNSYAGVPADRAYAMGNWARFVKPGWSRVSVTNQNANGMLISAFTNGTASMAIVVINNQSSAVAGQAFTLGGFAATQVTPWITSSSYNLQAQAPVAVSGNTFSYTIPADSIVTFYSSQSVAPTGSSIQGTVLQGLTIQ
jgi:glucuronoarabinoxylan endo-1,4-beta-xylanase